MLEIRLLAVRLLKELSHGLGRDQDLTPVVIPNSSPKDDLLVSHEPCPVSIRLTGGVNLVDR